MIQSIREKLLCGNLIIQTFALQHPMQAIIYLSASSLASDNIDGVTWSKPNRPEPAIAYSDEGAANNVVCPTVPC